MILVLGHDQEPHAVAVLKALERAGAQARLLHCWDFPRHWQLSLMPDRPELGHIRWADGQQVALDAIQAIYWRTHTGINLEGIADPQLQQIAHREIDSTLGSLLRSLPCRWVNSAEAVAMHRYKAYQTRLLSEQGLPQPRTLITNDPQAVQDFFEALSGEVIYKPVLGGAHTTKLTHEDLVPNRLEALAKAPVQFQEYIPGVDIRAYVVGQHLFAAEIQTDVLDFRNDPQAPVVPIQLPDEVAQQCRVAAKTLGLILTGIDIRRTPEGHHVFLEANPSPMFLYFQERTGYPIQERLVDLLLG